MSIDIYNIIVLIPTYIKVSRDNAVKYCSNLTLLDTLGWTLPSSNDIKILRNKSNIFTYEAQEYSDYYQTTDKMCGSLGMENRNAGAVITNIIMSPLLVLSGANILASSEYCIYKRDSSKELTTKRSTRGNRVRCVLDVEKYKEHQSKKLQKASQLRESETFNSYLNAFKLTKDISDIKKAYALASTTEEKLQAEKLMVKILPKKIFRLYNGKEGTSVAKSSGLDIGFSGSAIAEKDFSKTFTLKSDYLQYGSYNVKVKFNFDITYNEQRMISFYTSKEHKEKIVTFNLNSKNNYSQTKTVTFNDITVGMAMSTMGIKAINKTMKDNKLSFEIMGID